MAEVLEQVGHGGVEGGATGRLHRSVPGIHVDPQASRRIFRKTMGKAVSFTCRGRIARGTAAKLGQDFPGFGQPLNPREGGVRVRPQSGVQDNGGAGCARVWAGRRDARQDRGFLLGSLRQTR